MSEPEPTRPRSVVRETVALVLLVVWVSGPFLVVIGGLSSTSFDGDPVASGDYVLWRTVMWVGIALTLVGPGVVWMLSRTTAFRVAAGLEMVVAVVLVVTALS
ncbi:hypothetical protein [Aeromicrobium sp. Leaf350]|uniref:hypothetical protein n=1 Tax=Aeromicrobium sp. Leaf350 TaxID=2876565 RepID=UPI001E2DFC37|nr:hypothetical protein [Aeromicrobium sp. Leaf350]